MFFYTFIDKAYAIIYYNFVIYKGGSTMAFSKAPNIYVSTFDHTENDIVLKGIGYLKRKKGSGAWEKAKRAEK